MSQDDTVTKSDLRYYVVPATRGVEEPVDSARDLEAMNAAAAAYMEIQDSGNADAIASAKETLLRHSQAFTLRHLVPKTAQGASGTTEKEAAAVLGAIRQYRQAVIEGRVQAIVFTKNALTALFQAKGATEEDVNHLFAGIDKALKKDRQWAAGAGKDIVNTVQKAPIAEAGNDVPSAGPHVSAFLAAQDRSEQLANRVANLANSPNDERDAVHMGSGGYGLSSLDPAAPFVRRVVGGQHLHNPDKRRGHYDVFER